MRCQRTIRLSFQVSQEGDAITMVPEDTVVSVVGLGYVGLPSAALFASAGFRVVGVDVDARVVETVNAGETHLAEPGLASLVGQAVRAGLLQAQSEPAAADVYLIAVPTPVLPDFSPDLNYVETAMDAIVGRLRGGELIIIESTCPPGTTRAMAERMVTARRDLSWHGDGDGVVDFAHCPERVLPGRVMVELVENSRVVGGLTQRAADRGRLLYAAVCRGELRTTTAETAELVKLSENAFRDVNIAFANELSLVSERVRVDVWELIELANLHPRVNILQPGPGVGGHCIAVDPWFIVNAAPEEARLIRTAREVNDRKPEHVLSAVDEAVADTDAKHVACLGLSFKADVDDIRESPALHIATELARRHPNVTLEIVEPNLSRLPAGLDLEHVRQGRLDEVLDRAQVVVLLVDHAQFRAVDRSRLEGKRVIDTRGVWRTR